MEQAEEVARRAAAGFGVVRAMHRFPLGLCHYVYDVELVDGSSLVVRVASRDNVGLLRSAVEWAAVLQPMGVPLPAILDVRLDSTTTDDLPYLVLERLPGDDLGEVYGELSSAQRRDIARSVAAVQRVVATLPMGAGFGYVGSPAGPSPCSSWQDVVLGNLMRSRRRMHEHRLHDRLDSMMTPMTDYLEAVPSHAFLDDLTTKNVIVHEGRLSGVVDVDAVCFGDPLYTPALTKTALAAAGQSLDYVEHWLVLLDLSPEQRSAFDLYTAVFVLDLLSEDGQQFNRDRPETVSADRAERLRQLFESLVP